MSDLQHDRYVELTALGVIGIVLSRIGGEPEPVRIEVGADESVLGDRRF